jgi:hypothetical protein
MSNVADLSGATGTDPEDPVIFHDDLGRGPVPEVPEQPKGSREGWPFAISVLVIVALAIFSEWTFLRMLNDEERLMMQTSQEFQKDRSIGHNNCDWGMFKFSCSGVMVSSGGSVTPVRYTCDQRSCMLECSK